MSFKDVTHLLITIYPYLSWPNKWTDLIMMVERCSHEMRIITVSWKPPDSALMKLNTDGSTLSYPGRIGGGGILRDQQHNFSFLHSFGVWNQQSS